MKYSHPADPMCRHREVRGDDVTRQWNCVRCGRSFALTGSATTIAGTFDPKAARLQAPKERV